MKRSMIQRFTSRIANIDNRLRHGYFQGIQAMEAATFHQEIFAGETFEIPDLTEYKSEAPMTFQGHQATVPSAYIFEFPDAICITDREEVFTHNREVITDLTSQHINPLLGKSRKIINRIDRYLKGKTLHLSLSHFEDNYYAYNVEFLGRWWIFRNSGIDVDYVVLPLRNKFQREIAELLNIDPSKIIAEDGLILQCEKLIVPSLINNYKTYQIGDQELYSKHWLPSWLKGAYETVRSQTAQPAQGDCYSRIYITRRNASLGRRVTNEHELIEILERHRFTIIDLDNLPINEQISIFSNAEIIIAPHGAGLVNMSYCKKRVSILEIYPHRYHDNSFRLQSKLLNHDYHFIVDKNPTSITENHQYSDLTVDIDRVEGWILDYLPTRHPEPKTEPRSTHNERPHTLAAQ